MGNLVRGGDDVLLHFDKVQADWLRLEYLGT
jgi:hypothetical protein